MAEPITVTRTIDLPLPADELWDLISHGDRWHEWMGPSCEIEVTPGAQGEVTEDDGAVRAVRVDRVDRVAGVQFSWWPVDRADQTSVVELVPLPRQGGSRLLVREIRATSSVSVSLRFQHQWQMAA